MPVKDAIRQATLVTAVLGAIAPACGATDDWEIGGRTDEDCFACACRLIAPGEDIVVELTDGRRFAGSLDSFDTAAHAVTLICQDTDGEYALVIEADDILRYEYSTRDDAPAAVPGAILGAVAGVAAGLSAADGSKDLGAEAKGAVAGAVVGAVVGYAAGTAVGGSSRPAGVITCGDPAARTTTRQ